MRYLPLLLTLIAFFPVEKTSAQQYLRQRLVELSLETDEVKAYFEAFSTVFILSNSFCNKMNCDAANLRTSKKAMILTREELFLRNMDKWIEFTLIKRKKNKAVVKVKLRKKGLETFKFIQKRGNWYLE